MPLRSEAKTAAFSLSAATLALVVAHGLAAQEPPPTFKAESQVVILDVVARDGRDRPITDLREDEVQVFEDGQACTIVSFRLIGGRVLKPASVASGPPSEAGPGPEAAPPEPARANLVVLLFDRLAVQNAALARKGALELISQRFPPNTWFAIYKLNRSMQLLQPFTSDPKELAGGIERATTGDETTHVGGLTAQAPAPPPPPAGIPAGPDLPGSIANVGNLTALMARIAAGVEAEVGDLAYRVDSMDSLYALDALARGLGQVRGRKSILYFAEDRELPESVTQVYDSTLDAANKANVTVHTVDTRGLTLTRIGNRGKAAGVLAGMTASSGASQVSGTVSTELSSAEQSDGPGGPMMNRRATLQNAVQGSFLAHVALDTGGRVVAETNDLGAGLVPVVEEVGLYYEMVYEPARPEPDGRFRKIAVQTTRKGARLHTRSGYFATSESAPTLAAFELPLLAAMGAADPPRDIPHAATVMHFASAGREREAMFLAEVPLGLAHVVEDPARGTYRAHLALLGLLRDEAGRTVGRFSQDWPIAGPLGEQEKLPGTTAVFKRSFTLPPGGYTLVTAIHDREGKRTGVERTRFDVPPAEGGGLAVGSLAVVRKASGEPAAGVDPLRVSGVTIAPHVGPGELAPGTKEISLFLPIYPSLAAAPIALELEVRRAGDTVARSTPPLPAAGSDGRIAWIGSLPAKGMIPGPYEVVATVRQGDVAVEERAAFSILDRAAVGARPLPELSTPPPVPPDLVPVLEAAARYVLEYEASFQNIAADETYLQRALPRYGDSTAAPSCLAGGCLQTTKADVVFARLSGAVPWGCFRDVYEVDGRKVRATEGRLEALFVQFPAMSAVQRAEALLAESARYNVGPAIRTINFPTLTLAFLHPMNQGRFAWSRGGKRRFGTTEGVEVQFEEISRPTIVDRGGQSDLPARGRFWIDATRGTVMRSETSFRFESDRGVRVARAYVTTEYRAEPKLAMWVPVEMREEYEDVPGAGTRIFGSRTEATARYAGFRRFTVSTAEEGRVAEEPAGDPR